MAITYSVTQLVDPREPEVAGKFYAKAQASGIITSPERLYCET